MLLSQLPLLTTGTPLQQEARNLFAAMTVRPSQSRQRAINRLIYGMKANGSWAQFDLFYMTAAHNAQAATLNWKAPGTNTVTYTATEPTFDADRGLTGNGVDAFAETSLAYTSMTKYVQDSAHIAAYTLLDVTEAISPAGASGSLAIIMRPRSTGTSFIGRINDVTSGTYATQATAIGYFGLNRSLPSAALREWYFNGLQVKSDTTASTGLPVGTAVLLRGNTGYSTNQVACAHWGASLSADQWLSNATLILAYLKHAGAQ